MTKKNEQTFGRARINFCVILLFLSIITLVLSQCGKKQGPAYGPTGSCEVYDKLPSDITKHVYINYGGKFKLFGINTDKVSQNKFKISYFWKVIDDFGAYNTVFVHFTDKDNKILFQNDHDFCQKRPISELKGKFTKESYVVNIPQSAAGKEVNVKIGIYAPDLPDGPRLKIVSAGEVHMDDGNTRAIVEKLSL